MKKLMGLMLGLSLIVGATSLFAADDPTTTKTKTTKTKKPKKTKTTTTTTSK